MVRIASYQDLDTWNAAMDLVPRDVVTVKERLVRTGQLLHGLRRSLQPRGDEDT